MDQHDNIACIRKQIDEIDHNLLALLKERLHCAKSIGRLKNLTRQAVWDPAREHAIFERLHARNGGIFPPGALDAIFHEIICACRQAQGQTRVAFLGPEATFSHQAAGKFFGQSASYQAMDSIQEVFEEVERDRVDYGVIPVENSIEGAVGYSLDSFLTYKVQVCGEIEVPIQHHLLNQSGDLKDIKKVVSHAQALAQCGGWLRKHLPALPAAECSSTAASAQMAARDPAIGAIASALAASSYQLQVVARGIEDLEGNTTRFLVLGKKSPARSGADKTSIVFGLINRPGALNEILTILSAKRIDMTKLESRPAKNQVWKYVFFLDMTGHIDDPPIREACDILKSLCAFFHILGSYPAASTPAA